MVLAPLQVTFGDGAGRVHDEPAPPVLLSVGGLDFERDDVQPFERVLVGDALDEAGRCSPKKPRVVFVGVQEDIRKILDDLLGRIAAIQHPRSELTDRGEPAVVSNRSHQQRVGGRTEVSGGSDDRPGSSW